jgi:1,4-dihydroxy-2-naphthoate octaprenyltransferase
MMRRRRNVITEPWPYAAWAILVLITLASTYSMDPYIFGFSTLGLAAVSVVVGLVGLAATMLSTTTAWRAKAWILGCLVVTGLALATALGILRTFKWA